jgi:hypothetical protein
VFIRTNVFRIAKIRICKIKNKLIVHCIQDYIKYFLAHSPRACLYSDACKGHSNLQA